MEQGKYQDITLKIRSGPLTRARRNRMEVSASSILDNCKKLQKTILTRILKDFDHRLAGHKVVKLLRKIFDFQSYYLEIADLDAQYQLEFISLVEYFNLGTLRFPKQKCGHACAGSKCICLMLQYTKFKRRVMDPFKQKKYKNIWKKSVALKKGQNVRVLKENNEINTDNFQEYRANERNWEDAQVLRFYPKTNKQKVISLGRKRKFDLKFHGSMVKFRLSVPI